MNQDYEIYQAPEALVPVEDVARLDGYLKGRTDQVMLTKSMRPKLASSISTKKKKKN